ncbi:MAG: type II secretion system protein, partial [Ktedonobacteraceae bacterium]
MKNSIIRLRLEARSSKLAAGFTLIELLTVIAIIALLSSIILASLQTAQQKSRDAKRISDLKNIELALAVYYNDHDGEYPATLAGLAPDYLSVLPTDPSESGGCSTGAEAACYTYAAIGSGSSCTGYHLGASLEQTSNSALESDVDAHVGSGVCNGSAADFNGLSAAPGGSKCTATPGTPQPGGTKTCYDIH